MGFVFVFAVCLGRSHWIAVVVGRLVRVCVSADSDIRLIRVGGIKTWDE